MPPGKAARVGHLLKVSDPMLSASRLKQFGAADRAPVTRTSACRQDECLTYQAFARYVYQVAARPYTFQDF